MLSLSNKSEILTEISWGFDSFVFLDDNIFFRIFSSDYSATTTYRYDIKEQKLIELNVDSHQLMVWQEHLWTFFSSHPLFFQFYFLNLELYVHMPFLTQFYLLYHYLFFLSNILRFY